MILRVAVVVLFVGAISAFDLVAKRGVNRVCYQHPLDIAFVIDASASIWAQNFTKAKDFVNDFIDPYEISPSKVRVALVTYAHEVFLDQVIQFSSFDNKQDLQNRISNMVWKAGSRTETGMGIAYMRDHIMVDARPGLPKICIVITDGRSQEPNKTSDEAAGARAAGIDMFAIGVSKDVSREELKNIAGYDDRVIIVETYEELNAIKDKLSGKTCKDIPTPPPTKPADHCGKTTPTDVYYVFDQASLGIERTNWVTTFIRHNIDQEEFRYMRAGVISGSCPMDAGFGLNKYRQNWSGFRTRLEQYGSSSISRLVMTLVSEDRYDNPANRRVAVIFLSSKMNEERLARNLDALREMGVQLYFANTGDAPQSLLNRLNGLGFDLSQNGRGARRQAAQFVQQLCD